MRELISCWRNTRMIVLTALCAALYVAVLLPFKIATIVPGITEIRPGAALPVLFSFLFGPAAAWGSAFGNTIGDLLGGTIGPGSLFGFAGNFLYGYAPYRIMRRFTDSEKSAPVSLRWGPFLLSVFVASALCAMVIALGVEALKIVPFSFLVHTILLNNILVSVILVPLLAKALFKRVSQMRLTYPQLLESSEIARPPLFPGGLLILILLILAVYLLVLMPSLIPAMSSGGSLAAMEVAGAVLLIIAALLIL